MANLLFIMLWHETGLGSIPFNQFKFLSIQFNQFQINSMGVFPTQTHGIILICNCNRPFLAIVLEELFSKVIDPKVIYNSL